MNMDAKGRLAIPKRYHESIFEASEGQLIVTKDLHSPCLLIYTLDEWEIIERKLLSLPNMDPKTRAIQRVLIGHAAEVKMDAQGRLLLPSELRSLAQLDKGVILLGQGNKFELWSQSVWEEAEAEMARQAAEGEMSEALANLSL